MGEVHHQGLQGTGNSIYYIFSIADCDNSCEEKYEHAEWGGILIHLSSFTGIIPTASVEKFFSPILPCYCGVAHDDGGGHGGHDGAGSNVAQALCHSYLVTTVMCFIVV